MNLIRNILIGAIVVTCFLLFIRWNEFQERQNAALTSNQDTLSSQQETTSAPETPDFSDPVDTRTSDASDIPSEPGSDEQAPVVEQVQPQLVRVTTDTLEVLIDTKGGDIVKVALLQHYAKLNEADNPFILLNSNESTVYVAQSGLIGPNGTDGRDGRPLFSVAAKEYALAESKDSLMVDLTLDQGDVTLTKRFTFNKGSYLIDVDYLIDNRSDKNWSAALYGQIKRDGHTFKTSSMGMKPYLGAATTTPETHYEKHKFKDLEENPVKFEHTGGWVAMVQHYFISAWIPDAETTNHYNLRKARGKDIYLLGFTSERTTVAPNSQGVIKSSFYAGPKTIKTLEEISPYLDLTIDFSWLWFIAKPLFHLLDIIHGLVGNWGIAIIILTMMIKLLFFYPSAVSYRSMAKMRKIAPQMQELKERYGEDKQKMSTELMKLYKKEGANPVSGCLPMILPMPVFIALYWVLMESVELRHAPFMLWIHDLSVKDPYYVLPLIMGASMFFMQKLNPPPPDPMQAKMMQLMPLFFTFLFMMFPAGLVLYWVVNNLLSMTQQYIITKKIEQGDG
ncbi:membrane protein insertase YidC [Teredinibacter sp. KSP-S5-2]|uniref:membrane protein insertase YidC n=1 Tax=Teredinibacter sp. KSP-S5-2 TaxID=3034506 RepID=UPI0029344B89|nr:membrane protein insertase YidC [Teredinibacter sp. KSP-S5-2]WNO09128.1 membrane protein insertase YidC [Teredinibacter sp. KSP-S5-2]